MRMGKPMPIVNHMNFTDAPRPTLPTPTIGSPDASFNPGAAYSPLPNGPPKYVQPKGKRPVSKGLTNKRLPLNNI